MNFKQCLSTAAWLIHFWIRKLDLVPSVWWTICFQERERLWMLKMWKSVIFNEDCSDLFQIISWYIKKKCKYSYFELLFRFVSSKLIYWRNNLIEKIDCSMKMESGSNILFANASCSVSLSGDCQGTLYSFGP